MKGDPNRIPRNNGNYGVHYRLSYRLSRSAEEAEGLDRRFHLLANFRGGTKGASDASSIVFRVSRDGTGDYRTMFIGSGKRPNADWGWIMSTIVLPAGETEDDFIVELSPPGGANLPVALVMLPANIVARVEVRDGDVAAIDEWAPATRDRLSFHARFNYAISASRLESHPVAIQDREGRVVANAVYEHGGGADHIVEATLVPDADLEYCREYQLVLTDGSVRQVGESHPATLLTLGPSSGAPDDPSRWVHLFATSRSFVLAGGGAPTRGIEVDDELTVTLLHDGTVIDTPYEDPGGAFVGRRDPISFEICRPEPLDEFQIRIVVWDHRPETCEPNCRGLGIVTLFRDPSPTARVLHRGTEFTCGVCPHTLVFEDVFDVWPPAGE